MKPHAFAVLFANALVEIAICANKPLPFLAFLPTLTSYNSQIIIHIFVISKLYKGENAEF